MKIESIKLMNFRCFESLDLSFHPQLTVIVGKNASGKSTVLDAVAIAVGTFPSAFDGIGSYGIKKHTMFILEANDEKDNNKED